MSLELRESLKTGQMGQKNAIKDRTDCFLSSYKKVSRLSAGAKSTDCQALSCLSHHLGRQGPSWLGDHSVDWAGPSLEPLHPGQRGGRFAVVLGANGGAPGHREGGAGRKGKRVGSVEDLHHR